MENSKELWDQLWTDNNQSFEEMKFNLSKEENGTAWRNIKNKIMKHFDKLNSLNVVEIGAGTGFISALLAPMVKTVTTIDFSDAAIEKSKQFYKFLGIENVQHINGNALKLETDLLGKFDISMSFGLAEHFENIERQTIIKSHLDLIKNGGIAFISVPNKSCLPYRIWKKKREVLGKWHFGLEIPYSRKELSIICNNLGINDFFFIGSSFISSWNFILPFASWNRSIRKRLIPNYFSRTHTIKPEVSTPFDSYLGYALVLVFMKY